MSISSKDLTPEMLAQIGGQVKPRVVQAPHPAHQPNKWEKLFAMDLRLKVAAGEILWWAFEPIKLRLGSDWKTTYTPDFLVQLADGSFEFIEVKGHMRDDAAVKIKVAASQIPILFKLITKRKGESGWQTRIVRGAAQTPTPKGE